MKRWPGWAALLAWAALAGAAMPGLAAAAEAGALPADPTLAQCQASMASASAKAPAGGDRSPTEADFAADPAALAAVWDATRRRLQGAAQPQQQAAAWLMDRMPPGLAAGSMALPEPAVAGLVSLALATSDPVVLQWATQACDVVGTNTACQGLSARAWAQAEPDNLLAWLPVLKQQPQALDEALQAMAVAQRVDLRWMRSASVVLAARPPGQTGALRFAFDERLVSLAAAEPMLSWQPLLAACSDTALGDPRRRQHCTQIAERLAGRGRDFMSVAMGHALGRRLGWPAEREQARKALQAAAAGQALNWMASPELAACWAPLLEHQLLEMDRLGEVGLARQALQADQARQAQQTQQTKAAAPATASSPLTR